MPEGIRTRKCHLPQRPTQARSELLEEMHIHPPRVHHLLGRRGPEMPEGTRNHKPHVHHSPGGRNPQVPEGIRTRKRHLQLGPLRPARRTCRAHRAELAGRLVGTAREPAGPTAQILPPEWPRPRPFAKAPRTAGLARSDQGPPLAALRRRGPGPQSPRPLPIFCKLHPRLKRRCRIERCCSSRVSRCRSSSSRSSEVMESTLDSTGRCSRLRRRDSDRIQSRAPFSMTRSSQAFSCRSSLKRGSWVAAVTIVSWTMSRTVGSSKPVIFMADSRHRSNQIS